MMLAYDTRIIALTLGVPRKWVDNMLSHFILPGVSRSKQGVERRVSDKGLLALAVSRVLMADLGMSARRAVRTTETLFNLRSGDAAQLRTAHGVLLEVNFTNLEKRLNSRIIDAVEAVPRIRRGRPPQRNQ